jgi:hypothetical protein
MEQFPYAPIWHRQKGRAGHERPMCAKHRDVSHAPAQPARRRRSLHPIRWSSRCAPVSDKHGGLSSTFLHRHRKAPNGCGGRNGHSPAQARMLKEHTMRIRIWISLELGLARFRERRAILIRDQGAAPATVLPRQLSGQTAGALGTSPAVRCQSAVGSWSPALIGATGAISSACPRIISVESARSYYGAGSVENNLSVPCQISNPVAPALAAQEATKCHAASITVGRSSPSMLSADTIVPLPSRA